MEEEKYILEKRHEKGKLYRNKLRRIFKEEVILCQYFQIESTGGIYFQVIIGDKIYFRSYTPIEKVKFKDMLSLIYESYWYDIFERYINFEEIAKYLPIKEKIDLVEKQQKEIEKLKSRKYIFNAETNEIKEIPISDDYISKDKIKEKIEELEKPIQEGQCLNVIQGYVREGNLILLKDLLGE